MLTIRCLAVCYAIKGGKLDADMSTYEVSDYYVLWEARRLHSEIAELETDTD